METFEAKIGETRDEIDEALAALEVPARDRVAALGLRKVIEDRCTFEIAEGVDPEKLRAEVFWAAAKAHRALDVRADFDREAVLAEVAVAQAGRDQSTAEDAEDAVDAAEAIIADAQRDE